MMPKTRLKRCPACGQARDKGLSDERFSLSVSYAVGGGPLGLFVTCKRCVYEWSEPCYGEVPGEE